MSRHSHRGSIDDACNGFRLDVADINRLGLSWPVGCVKFASQIFRPRNIDVCNDQLLRSEREKGVGNGRPCTASAKLKDLVQLDAWHVFSKTFLEAGLVSIIAHKLASAHGNGVYCANITGTVRQFIKQWNDRLLEGVRYVDTAIAFAGKLSQQGFKLRVISPRLREIEQLVCQLKALCASFLLVQPR